MVEACHFTYGILKYMALFLKQPDKRSELQSRVAEELRDKLNARDLEMGESEPVSTEKTTPTKGAGIIFALLLIGIVVAIVFWLTMS